MDHPSLLCLHGFLGQKEDWDPMLSHLSVDATAIDLPFAGDIALEVHKQAPKAPYIVGYSAGGRVALELKERFPNDYGTLILNGGGGIFSFVGEMLEENIRNEYFAAAHATTFEKAAELFGLGYTLVEKMEDLDALDEIIELQTFRDENYDLHKEIEEKIKDALCSSIV